jgi:hypothetical protein
MVMWQMRRAPGTAYGGDRGPGRILLPVGSAPALLARAAPRLSPITSGAAFGIFPDSSHTAIRVK